MIPRSLRVAFPLFLFSFLAPPLLGQGETKKEAVQQEVNFIRKLAKDWGFVDLAKDALNQLRKDSSGALDDQLLAQLEAEILYLGAKRIPDLDRRRQVLQKALQKFEDYLAQYGREEGALEVLYNLGEACEFFGEYLRQAQEAEKDPDKRKTLQEELVQVYTKGIQACNDLMDRTEEKREESPKARLYYYRSWLRKGVLQREWGRVVPQDRAIKVKEAVTTLEDMVLEAGEETPLGMIGLLEIAQCQDVLGDTEMAIAQFNDTVEIVSERLRDQDNPVTPAQGMLLFNILERAYVKTTEVLLREGKTKDVLKHLDSFKKISKEFERDPSFRLGDQVLLNGAQALMDTGSQQNINQALDTARNVARRHPTDFIGLKAKELIKQILSVASGNISAEALYQAASGDFQSGKDQQAIEGFKKVLTSLKTEEEKNKYGLRSWGKMGDAFRRQGRLIEAFYAFREGLKHFRHTDAAFASAIVDRLVGVVRLKKKATKDNFFKTLEEEANRIAVSTGGKSKNRILWNKVQAALDGKDPRKALIPLNQIGKDFLRYDLVPVYKAIAHYKLKDFTKARKELTGFLKFVSDPYNKLPPSEGQRISVREIAVGQAKFYLGLMDAEEALGLGKMKGRKPNPTKLKNIVEAFRGFREKYKGNPSMASFAQLASFYLIRGYVGLEQIETAELEYQRFSKDFPKSPQLSQAAMILFTARDGRVSAIRKEMAAIKKKFEKNPSVEKEWFEIQKRFKLGVLKTLSFARTYLQIEKSPDYALLRKAAKLASEIQDWDQAELFLQKIVQVFGESPTEKDKISKFIKPELAQILLRKLEFRKALQLLNDSLKLRPKSYKLKLLKARALGGWIDMDKKGRIVNPGGLERFEEAYSLLWGEKGYRRYIQSKKVQKYSLAWYRFYLDCLDIALKASRKGNSDYLDFAKSLFNIANSTDDFETLKALGAEGKKLYRLFLRLKP
jgi:tetratricopeptide (TPR) repeat protein